MLLQVLCGLVLLFMALPAVSAQAKPTASQPSTFLLKADLSALPLNEQAGIVYTNHGRAADCIQIFKQNGWNLVRLRLWVQPSGRDGIVNDLAYDAAVAKRAKAAGMKVMIDFHYSDSWTDAGNQAKPASWAADTLSTPNTLGSDIFWYTSNAIYTLAHKYHVAADYIEIGNEVTYGMLWLDGSLSDGGHGGWANWTAFATGSRKRCRTVSAAASRMEAGETAAGAPCLIPKLMPPSRRSTRQAGNRGQSRRTRMSRRQLWWDFCLRRFCRRGGQASSGCRC